MPCLIIGFIVARRASAGKLLRYAQGFAVAGRVLQQSGSAALVKDILRSSSSVVPGCAIFGDIIAVSGQLVRVDRKVMLGQRGVLEAVGEK